MIKRISIYGTLAAVLWLTGTCRKPYVPIVFVKGDNYLVVDGFINTAPNGITNIQLSETKNLTDTVINRPVTGAKITLQSANGASYVLQEQGSAGNYITAALNLSNNATYRVNITTGNKQYQSDYVSVKAAPAIDSVSWMQDVDGVHLFVDTHDPFGNTHYYRWQYVLTWEYQSQLETPWGVRNGMIYARDFSELVHVCYQTNYSSSVLMANSLALSQDIISHQPLVTFPPADSMLSYRISINTRQFALSPQAYSYWQTIKNNAEQRGGLFDLQPSQLEGNIHSLSNPAEPVVGFMSAGTVTEKRIFIHKDDLQNWTRPPGSYNCYVRFIAHDPQNFVFDYPDTTYSTWYFTGGVMLVAKKYCLDCTLTNNGTTTKPPFW